MDIDICGPSTPRVMGVEGEQVHQSGSGWSPIVSRQQYLLQKITNSLAFNHLSPSFILFLAVRRRKSVSNVRRILVGKS